MSTFLSLLILFFLASCSLFDGTPKNARKHRDAPVVILISIDGYRSDYSEIFKPKHITSFFSDGVKADALLSIYPSMTFPNHYSIATGMYAESHGITANSFWSHKRGSGYSIGNRETVRDGTWYGGTPLWVAAREQGMVSATYFWVGSEADIKGVRPHYYFDYDGRVPHRQRIDQVKEWLSLPARNRPQLITLYFSEVDSRGHRFGAAATEVGQSLLELDQDLSRLFEFVEKADFDINIILVSDHGMMTVTPDYRHPIDDWADFSDFELYPAGPMVYFYGPNQERINEVYNQIKKREDPNLFRVYLKEDIPERYRLKNAETAPDILLDAVMPHIFAPRERLFRISTGVHGWDPQRREMKSIFYAKGPQFVSEKRIPEFENVHIYPLILHILGLRTPETDGKLEVLAPILRR